MRTVQVYYGVNEIIGYRGYPLNLKIKHFGNTQTLKLSVGIFFLNAKRHHIVIFVLLSSYINYLPAKTLSLINLVNSLNPDQA